MNSRVLVSAQRRAALPYAAIGLYVWLITLALPAFAGPSAVSWLTRAVASVSGILLVGGAFIRNHPRYGRIISLYAAVGSSALCWVLIKTPFEYQKLDPWRAFLGAFGWLLFALSWAERPKLAEQVTQSALIRTESRQRFPRGALAIVAISVGGSLLLNGLAWRVKSPLGALAAQALALVASMATVGVGTKVALEIFANRNADPAALRVNTASANLAALVIVLGLGLLWFFLH